VARVADLRPRPEISLTTNGIGLARLADPLRAAGLDRLNVSLDTLSPETFQRLARRDRLADVLAGLAAAAAAGLDPVKVNTVLMRGANDREAPELLEFCLAHGYQLRFIEQMPLDAPHGWQRSQMLTADEILAPAVESLHAHPGQPGIPGRRAGREVPGRRRPGYGRRDRVGDPAVLRHLRPGPADGRRPTARCATACSPGPSPTCARRCAPGPATRRSLRSGPAP
jgi:Radical SAM superfamily